MRVRGIVAAVLLGLGLGVVTTEGRPARLPAPGGAGVSVVGEGRPPDVGKAVLDSARNEIAAGRFLHAARLLEDALSGVPDTSAVARRLVAEAEAGNRRWGAVLRALAPLAGDALGAADELRLGRAELEVGDPRRAAAAFRRVLRGSRGGDGAAGPEEDFAARVGLARALFAVGEPREGWRVLRDAAGAFPRLADRTAAEGVRRAADAGSPAVARAAFDEIRRRDVRDGVREALVEAHLVAGDTVGALDRAVAGARAAGDRTVAATLWITAGELRLRKGSADGARTAFLRGLRASVGVAGAAGAAEQLAGAAEPTAEELELAADALDRAGRPADAAAVVERHLRLAGGADPGLRIERGRLLLRAGRPGEAAGVLEEVAPAAPGADGAEARFLAGRARFRRGESARGREHFLAVARLHPGTPEAAFALFLLGDVAHDGGRLEEAEEMYRRAVETRPGDDRAGLARMRLAQMALGRGGVREAVRHYEAYLDAFPRGRRWEQATYWAARLRLELDPEDSGARELLSSLRSRNPFSYYAFLAAELQGEQPTLPGVGTAGPPADDGGGTEEPPAGVRELDLLRRAGMEGPARAEGERLAREAGGDREAVLRLAGALARRGYGHLGVRLGYRILARGGGWTRDLIEAVYPFPHRELLRREALEWGLDPFLLAGVARRESVFDDAAASGAGAVGLLQLLPETAREAARREGMEVPEPDALRRPDVSAHLGAAHLSRILAAVDAGLPAALAAYNAGLTPVRSWLDFPEADDPLRFVERIPYRETRRYVKAVLANAVIYRILYGPDRGAGVVGIEG